jgi:replication factor A1
MLHMPIDEIVKKISDGSKQPEDKIRELIKAKCDAHQGLVSEEGAAHIVAHDLNVELFKMPDESGSRVEVKDLVIGMRTFEIVGKVMRVFPIREFQKQGKQSQVGNFNIADASGTTRIVLWDQKANVIKEGKLTQGQVVKVKNGNIKSSDFSPNGKEIHLNIRSQLILDVDEDVNVATPEPGSDGATSAVVATTLDKLDANQKISSIGTIVKIYPPAFYDACPQCNRKVFDGKCKDHGEVEHKPAMVLSLIIDDGKGAIRCTAFSNIAEKIAGLTGVEAKEKSENIVIFQEELDNALLGVIVSFEGSVRDNKQFDRIEITINSADINVNPLNIAKELVKD